MSEVREFGIKHIKSGDVFGRFDSESEALTWLAGNPALKSDECETVHRHLIWSDWTTVHND